MYVEENEYEILLKKYEYLNKHDKEVIRMVESLYK